MSTRALSRQTSMPTLFEDFFKPWSQWFDDSGLIKRVTSMPAVNIAENNDNYMVTLAAPGLKKEDFKIDLDGNMLTISSEKEENKEEKDEKYTRQEYSYSSFSRSFTLPEDVKQENIDASYQNGELKIVLPRKEEFKKAAVTKQIAIK
jgi:HSP20 family protein